MNILLTYLLPIMLVWHIGQRVNIWNIIYLNCGESYEDMIDYRNYTHNLSSCKIIA